MSQATANGSFERDIAVTNADRHRLDPSEIAIGVIIGRTSEFFDFFVFAIASVIVFPARIFSFTDPVTGTLYSFAIFALAFVARPFGTWLFMTIDRRHGKGVKLTIALFGLGTSTVAVAFLPTYDQIGMAAVWLLVALRIGQGISLGGTWDGLASLLAMNAPEKHRGWWAMVPQLGAPFGLIVASGLFAFFHGFLPKEQFLDFGWQFPFFCAFAINVVALFARLRIVATPEYVHQFQRRELQATRLRQTVRSYGRFIVIGAFTPLASFALFHMVTVYPLSWIALFTDDNVTHFLIIEGFGAAVGAIAIITSGFLADKYGRRQVLWMCAVLIAIFSGFAPSMLDQGTAGEIIFMVTGFALLGVTFGQCSGAVASNFPRSYRYTGSALVSDLAWLFGAGFAPFVALFLSDLFGLIAAGAYLLSGAICTLLALRYNERVEYSEE
ncbi:Predicted arabinose efflux permease, MFS family [Fulvimarina manganoxydans]|uniref:Predicted arabinose efflux permease, MFS family n=1 Tax=Fulvimarina manganoxydans TaxID=937218 RepID=A0A1W2E020_9HYPH|nr:MFS transporter [Fulvimarina manganoxydans]SMD02722.1 Predicted arabinose efflux permease, MFS family [Fulvimarina manganoxydans]